MKIFTIETDTNNITVHAGFCPGRSARRWAGGHIYEGGRRLAHLLDQRLSLPNRVPSSRRIQPRRLFLSHAAASFPPIASVMSSKTDLGSKLAGEQLLAAGLAGSWRK